MVIESLFYKWLYTSFYFTLLNNKGQAEHLRSKVVEHGGKHQQ